MHAYKLSLSLSLSLSLPLHCNTQMIITWIKSGQTVNTPHFPLNPMLKKWLLWVCYDWMSFALSFKTLTLGSLLSFLLNFANSFSSGLLHPYDAYSARTCKSNCSYTFGIFINCKQKQTEAKTRNPLHILYANICITMEIFTPWPVTASYTVANELMYVLCKTTWSGKVHVRLGHLHGNMKGIFFSIWSCQVKRSRRRTVFH